MLWFLCIFFFATTVWLFLQIKRARQLMSDLKDSVHAQRRFLPEPSSATVSWNELNELIGETNDFVERHRLYAEENTGYSKQIESMLRAVQEVLVIFDGNRVIEFASRTAEEVFHSGRSMKGLRVDTSMRSLALLEFLEKYDNDSLDGDNQLSYDHAGKTYWFEASCTQVRSIVEPRQMSSFLVLHDITNLKNIEVMRREFVANVSHELRTPLTIIKGFGETLVEDHEDLPIEMRARYLNKVLNNAERLHVLVEDLLCLSRLESKTETFDLVTQPLHGLLADVSEDYQSRLESGQEIVIDCEDTLPAVPFDRFRINQVLDNLIANVFRYAPEFTTLTIGAHYDEASNMVVCSISDDGPGIPAEDLNHLFERFYRVDKGRSQERGGTGLGLSIVKHIVQMHQGSVSAESEEGAWTKISFTLPCAKSSEKVTD